MFRLPVLILLFVIMCATGCSALSRRGKDLETVNNLDLERYLGAWYQIAYFPTRFQKSDCGEVVTAEYGLDEKGRITVHNVCWKDKEMTEIASDIKGRAFQTKEPGKLRVQFFFPIRAPYWIIDLDEENYSYSVVSGPSMNYLWILARENEMSAALYGEIVQRLADDGFETDKLVITGEVR
jgi:apolipoprotein D and lipocalin family protein